jgi:nucleoside-diphosphate-sugar epimerase
MRVLVTGANGFVGSALCPHLVAFGHQVVPAVRQPSGTANERIVHDKVSWKAALEGCDSVIHLAARAHVMQDREPDPLEAFRSNNVNLTIKLANQAVEAGVRRFVFMSTIKVNGEATAPGCNFTPDDLPAPEDPYAISKWEAEQGLLEIAQRTRLELVIIRPPLVYGPGAKGNFATLLQVVQRGWPLPLGAVHNRRSLVALHNLVHFIILCTTHPQASNQIFMVSDGHDLSTAELVQCLARAARVTPRLLPIPMWVLKGAAALLGQSDTAQRLCGNLQVDISKARRLLGWVPPISVDEGLRRAAAREWRR